MQQMNFPEKNNRLEKEEENVNGQGQIEPILEERSSE